MRLLLIQAIIIFWRAVLLVSDDTVTTLHARCQDVTVDAEDGCIGHVSPKQVDNGSSGDIASMILNQTDFEGTGSFPLQLRVEDVNGNVDTCEAIITVNETYHCTPRAWIAVGVIFIVGVPLLLIGLCMCWCRRRQRFSRSEDVRMTQDFQPPPRPEERVEPRREEPLDNCFLLERLARLEGRLPKPCEPHAETPPMVKGEDVIVIPPQDVLPAEASAPMGEDASAPYEDASISIDFKDVTPPAPQKKE